MRNKYKSIIIHCYSVWNMYDQHFFIIYLSKWTNWTYFWLQNKINIIIHDHWATFKNMHVSTRLTDSLKSLPTSYYLKFQSKFFFLQNFGSVSVITVPKTSFDTIAWMKMKKKLFTYLTYLQFLKGGLANGKHTHLQSTPF